MVNNLIPIIPQFASHGRGWDWNAHRRAGYIGGDDYETPSGTALSSPVSGHATRAGTTVSISPGDGRTFTMRHIHPAGSFPRLVTAGSGVIATSGADGGKWPHYEATVGGKRVSFVSQLVAHQLAVAQKAAADAAAASPGGIDVRKIGAYLNRYTGPRYHTNAATNGIRGPIYWRMVQIWGKNNGLYGAGYIINGIPGAKSRAVEAYLNSHI